MTMHQFYNIDDADPLPRRADHSRAPLHQATYTSAWLVGGRWAVDPMPLINARRLMRL